ncbi:MAG: hypothetical protein AAFU85_06845 [Planctomycetota bacterium]
MKTIQFVVLAVMLPLASQLSDAAESAPTFSSDVASIIHQKCTVCHRPGSSGPFGLITYDDVQRRSATIDAVLESRYMPPWKPLDHGIAFANNRRLSEKQTQVLRDWIAADCPPGDLARSPAPPAFTDGWALGKPDLVVKMNGTFDVPADGPDVYRSFVFHLGLKEDKWVKAVELRPSAKTSVHHALFFLDRSGSARRLDGADGQAGISGMGFLIGGDARSGNTNRGVGRFRRGESSQTPIASNGALASGLGGYVPGSTPNRLPDDFALALPSGSDIVMQTHFHPSGKAETEQAELALYFADGPPSREIVPVMVPPMFGFGSGIRIPPGDAGYVIRDSIMLPVETRAVGVAGHAHYLCREMKLTAELPGGEHRTLLHIDDWDLDWQDQYLFDEIVRLPPETVLHSELRYDNSVENPENPHHPPKQVRWGRGSADEMGSMTLMAVAVDESGTTSLREATRQHVRKSIINQPAEKWAQMLMQLDTDHDGKLQRKEVPLRLDARIFRLLDRDKDEALDESEIRQVTRVLGLFRR